MSSHPWRFINVKFRDREMSLKDKNENTEKEQGGGGGGHMNHGHSHGDIHLDESNSFEVDDPCITSKRLSMT